MFSKFVAVTTMLLLPLQLAFSVGGKTDQGSLEDKQNKMLKLSKWYYKST
jgi:hypothetical protein